LKFKSSKFIILLLFLSPLIINSQTFKSYGLNFGTTFHEEGWEKPDTFSYYYHDKVYISTYTIGLYGEFLAKKYVSTIVNASFRARQYFFEYDLVDISEAMEVKNTLYFATLSVTEKLKFDFDRWSIYTFGGFKADYQISKSIDKDFQNVFDGSKQFLLGTTAGIGFAKRIAKFWRVSFDLYYDYDITKMYESSNGYVRNQGFGFKIGFGPYNPANK